MKKAMNIITPVMLVLLLVFNIFTYVKVHALEEAGGEDYADDIAQEDDVEIGGGYVIRSTTQISDAYKSGDASKLLANDKETLDMASAVLDEIIADGMSDFEKERAVYDWMCTNLGFDEGSMTVIPESEADCDNPYGVLKYHNAVCVGYATTFRLFMQMLDIDCMVVHDSYRSHSWDLVKLDGQWYHTDIYSDSDTGNYAHFNLNDATMMNMQDWNLDFFPAAEGYEYNYAYMNRVTVADAYGIPAVISAAVDSENNVFGIEFENGEELPYELIEEVLNRTQMHISATMGDVWLNWSWLNISDTESILSVSLARETDIDDPAAGLSEVELEKIDSAISAAFGG